MSTPGCWAHTEEMNTPGCWADGFTRGFYREDRTRGPHHPHDRLRIWAVFHSLVAVASPSPPPIPPMVLQLLNEASVGVMWNVVDNASKPVVFGRLNLFPPQTPPAPQSTGEVTFDNVFGRQPLTLAELSQPNWWRGAMLKASSELALFATLPLRLRRLKIWAEQPVPLAPLLSSAPFRSLRYIEMRQPSDLADCARIPTLKKLTLYGVAPLSALASSPSLTELELSCTEVTSEGLAGLERMPMLTKLDLSGCRDVTSVACLAGSRSLAVLILDGTKNYLSGVTSEGLAGLDRIPTLTTLILSLCSSVTSVSALGGSTSLTELDLRWSSVTSDGLVGLERIPTLRKIDLHGCKSVTSVSCLSTSTSLTELLLCDTFVTSDGLVGLECIPTLTKLNVDCCESVLSLSSLAASPSLVDLSAGLNLRFPSEGLEGLGRIRTLRSLNLEFNKAITSVSCLAESVSLAKLDLRCSAVTSVACLADCKSLVELELDVTPVTSEGLKGLGRIPTLTKLSLFRCESVTSVTCLAESTSLVTLSLRATSVTLAGLHGVGRIPTLMKLDVEHSKVTPGLSLADLRKEDSAGLAPPIRRHRAESP